MNFIDIEAFEYDWKYEANSRKLGPPTPAN